MIVQTFRLELGSPRIGDAELLYAALLRSPITQSMASDGPESLDVYKQQLRRWRRDHRREVREHFIIRCRETEQPIGSLSFPEVAAGHRVLSYWLAASHQGRGYMSEALEGLLGWSFTNFTLQQVEAFVFVGNLASRRVLEKNGFHFAGYRNRHRLKQQTWVDAWRFVLTRRAHEQRTVLCQSLGVA